MCSPTSASRRPRRIDAALAAGEYDSLDPRRVRRAAQCRRRARSPTTSTSHRLAGRPAAAGRRPSRRRPPPRIEAGVVRADKLAGGIGYIEVVGFPPPEAFKPALDRAMAGARRQQGADHRRAPQRRRRPAGGRLPGQLPAGGRTAACTSTTSSAARPEPPTSPARASYSEPTPVSFAGVPGLRPDQQPHLLGRRGIRLRRQGARPRHAGRRADRRRRQSRPAASRSATASCASIPFGRAENPVTKTNWEGHGVDPDVAVPAGDALKVALERLGAEPAADIAAASREQVFAPRADAAAGHRGRAARAGRRAGERQRPTTTRCPRSSPKSSASSCRRMQGLFASLGELKSVTFREPGMMGGDAYDVVFANGGLIMCVGLGPEARSSAAPSSRGRRRGARAKKTGGDSGHRQFRNSGDPKLNSDGARPLSRIPAPFGPDRTAGSRPRNRRLSPRC